MKKILFLFASIAITITAVTQIQPITELEMNLSKSDIIEFYVPKKSEISKDEPHWHVTFEEEEPVWTFGWDADLQEKSWQVTDQDGIPEAWGNYDEGWYLLPLGSYSETGSIYDSINNEWIAKGKWAWIDIIGDYGAFGGDGQYPLNSWIQFDSIDLSEVEHPKLSFYQMFRPLNQVRSYIDFSTDGGNTWTEVQVNENIASNDYGDILFEMYIGNFVANDPDVSIRFRWHTTTVGTAPVGYGWQIDDIKITDNPMYDLYLYDARMNFFDYVDYTQPGQEWMYHLSSHYGQVPVAQYNSENALSWFNVAVENKGTEIVTPMLNVQVLDPEQNVIFNETMEGVPLNILGKAKDTLDMIFPDYNFELSPDPITGLYLIAYEVFIDGVEDENPADNVDTAFFYVTDYTFGRDAKVPENDIGSIGLTNWVLGGEDGDMIATEYLFLYETDVKNIEVFIHEKTDVGTAFTAKIMHYDQDFEDYVYIANSTLIPIEEEHLGTWVTVDFIDGDAQIVFDAEQESKMVMVAIENHYLGHEKFYIGTDSRNNYSSWGAYVFFTTESGWYRARDTGICIRLNMEDNVIIDTCEYHTIAVAVQNPSEENICDGQINIFSVNLQNNESTLISLPEYTNLCPGIYNINVINEFECSYSTTINLVVDPYDNLNAYVVTTDVSSEDLCNGTAKVFAGGGNPPYTFLHSNDSSNQYINGLCEGLYNVTITDANMNEVYANYLISNPSNLINNIVYQDSIVIGVIVNDAIENCDIDYNTINEAYITSIEYFDNDTISAEWLIVTDTDSTYITVLYYFSGQSGVYTVVLSLYCAGKNINNFFKITDQIYYNPHGLNIEKHDNKKFHVKAYPNPFNDNLKIEFDAKDNYKITIYDLKGRIVYNKNYYLTDLINLDLNKLDSGYYIISVISNTNIANIKVVKQK